MEQNQTMSNGQKCEKCVCPHHKMVPIFIALLGLVFLLNSLGLVSASATSIIWPIILIVIGLQKMFEGYCKCC